MSCCLRLGQGFKVEVFGRSADDEAEFDFVVDVDVLGDVDGGVGVRWWQDG